MIVILDAGHGKETPGKRSPDNSIFEYKYCREIRDLISKKLKDLGIQVEYTVTNDEDMPLAKRCEKANKICDKYGVNNCLFISIHLNAAGNGTWLNARGWEAYTSIGNTKADLLATYLYKAALCNLPNMKIRSDYTDKDIDKEANFYVLKHTKCAAVLTENLFLDNKKDVEFLLSNKGKESLVNLHVEGIVNYIKSI